MKKIILSTIIINTFLFSSNILNDNVNDLNKINKDIIYNNYKIDKNSWLSNPNLSYNANRNDYGDSYSTNDNYNFSYSQDIFKSGGIYYAIDYASINKDLQLLEQENQQTDLEFSIINSILTLKILNNDLKSNQLSLENFEIQYKILKESYRAGESNIVSLNDKLININNLKISINNLKQNKIELLEKIKNNSNIKNIDVLNDIISKKEYLSKNKNIKMLDKSIQLNNVYHKLNSSQFLPSVSLNYDYKKFNQLNENNNVQTIGIKISLPIDFNSSNKIEKSKLEVLKFRKLLEIKKDNESNKYDSIIAQIKTIDNKIEVSKENIKIYKDLLEIINENISLELKTVDDRTIMENNRLIEELNIINYDINKDILIYNLKYSME